MERMEIEHKKQLDKLNATYDSLRNATINGCDNVDMGYVRYCQGCDKWFNIEYEGVCGGDCQCFKCDTCTQDENTGIYGCNECGDPICLECNEFKMLDCCKVCYVLKQYPLVISNVFSNYDEVVDEFNRKHV